MATSTVSTDVVVKKNVAAAGHTPNMANCESARESFSWDIASGLREQVDLDSMDFLNFLTCVSKRFQVEVPEKDYGRRSSLDDFVAYLAE